MKYALKSAGLLSALVGLAAIGGGCASSQKHFDRIVPGMTQDEVRETMSEGPSRFENIASTDYTSWYWGSEYCVLFKNNQVVAKDAATEGSSGSAKGVEYKEQTRAQCLAPGQTAKSGSERTVNIPGIGTVHLPGGG